jgi:hypothetical protein
MPHLTTDSLIAYMEGSLAGPEQKLAKEHVECCSRCFAETLEWSCLFESLRFQPLQNPPENATRNCVAMYKRGKPMSIGRQIMATIVFDSAFARAAAGIRGSSDVRQVRLCGGDGDIHLRISENGRRIFGQIFHCSDNDFVAGARVQLLQDGEVLSTVMTDAMGEFGFNLTQGGDLKFEVDFPSGFRLDANITSKESNQ